MKKDPPHQSYFQSYGLLRVFSGSSKRRWTKRLSQKNIKLILILPNYYVKGFGYDGPKETSEQKVESFIKMLTQHLNLVVTFLFVDSSGLGRFPEYKSRVHHNRV
jgi:hypothetical protein